MKRKIFSKLLMGAFLIASVSSFVSCKDYDDDINNLQKQIDAAALKADLTALQQNLAAQISEAKSAAAAAQAAAEAAQKTADNAATKDALEAVKTAANNAGTAAAQAIADAANALVAANAAQTTANNAGSAAEKAAADAAKAIADAAAAQNTANVASTAAAAAQEAAKVAQTAAEGANTNATKALADAASALSGAAAAQEAAKAAQTTASSADATAKEAKATADNALAAAGNAAAQAAEALAAASAAQKAAAEAKYNDEAVRVLIDNAQKSADAAAADAKTASEAAAAAVLASASATEDATAAKAAADKIDEAIAAATKAINEATDAKIEAAVAEVVAKIPADQSETVTELASKLEALGTAEGGVATKEGLAAVVEDLQGKIDAATVSAETIAEVAAAAGTIKDALNEFLTAITSVELFNTWNADNLNRLNHKDLKFYWAEEVADWDFGYDLKYDAKSTKVTLSDVLLTDYSIPFTKNKVNLSKDSVVIRVVPIKAELTPDMVALVNTQGDTISSDFIKVGKPYRLTEKLTRATDVEVGGLWVVPFEVNDAEFTKEIAASTAKIDKTKGQKPYAAEFNKFMSLSKDGKIGSKDRVLFAVAIKTHQAEAEADSRRLITQHDLTVEAVMAEHANDDFAATAETLNAKKDGYTTVGGKIGTLKNRYLTTEDLTFTESVPEYNYAGGIPTGFDKAYNYGGWNKAFAPADMVIGKNVANRTGVDNRQNGNFLEIDVDDEITIDFSKGRTSVTSDLGKRIKAFYVTLDAPFALESDATELQAWSTYEYTNSAGNKTVAIYDVASRPIANSGKMFEGETGVIRFHVDEDKVAALAGEIIGFRVYAVNFDGTLVNPDGRAFYIKIKKDQAKVKDVTASIEVKPTKAGAQASDFVAIPNDLKNLIEKGYTYTTSAVSYAKNPIHFKNGNDAYREVTAQAKGKDDVVTKYGSVGGAEANFKTADAAAVQNTGAPFTVTFYDGNDPKKANVVTDLSKAQYFKATYTPENLVDDTEYHISYDLTKNYDKYGVKSEQIATLTINLTKKIDAGALPAWFGVKPEAIAADGKIHICLAPSMTDATRADANSPHKNYHMAAPYATGTSVSNVGWYQVSEVLKGAKADPDNIILSFNNADAYDVLTPEVQNAMTDDFKNTFTDNDGAGVSTFIYNTMGSDWLSATGTYGGFDEWSQWGTTNNLSVFSDPTEALKKAAAETDPIKQARLYQDIRNSWPAANTDMKVGAYYDNKAGEKISRKAVTLVTDGSKTTKEKTMTISAATSVKADIDDWKTFSYSCWHHSAVYQLRTVQSYDLVWNESQGKYVLKLAPKQIALSVKYGNVLAAYTYYNGTEVPALPTTTPKNGSIAIANLDNNIIYTNPYLTVNTGRTVLQNTQTSLTNSWDQNGLLVKATTDVTGTKTYPRVVDVKGSTATDAELAQTTYYKYDTATNTLIKQKNVATFVNKVTEYIQYMYYDFWGHEVLIEVPFDILPE